MADFYERINSSAKYTTLRGGRGNGITNSLLKLAYEQGRADQKEEDNAFFNFEGAWELEKKKYKADVIGEFATRLEEELTMVMPRDKVKYVMYKVHTVLEQLKENK